MGIVREIETTTFANFTCERVITLGSYELYQQSCHVVFDRTRSKLTWKNGTCADVCPQINAKKPSYREFYELDHKLLLYSIAEKSVDLSGQASGFKFS